MNSVQLNRQIIVLMMGYPGAGKSYFARQYAEMIGGIHLSDNRIRYELYEHPTYEKGEDIVVERMLDYMLDEFVASGKSIVFDVRANKKSYRKKFREKFKRMNIPVITVWIQTDLESSFDRANRRDRRLIDDKFVPSMEFEAFDVLQKQLQKPMSGEAIVISGKHLFRTQSSTVNRKVKSLGYIAEPEQQNGRGRVDLSRRRVPLR